MDEASGLGHLPIVMHFVGLHIVPQSRVAKARTALPYIAFDLCQSAEMSMLLSRYNDAVMTCMQPSLLWCCLQTVMLDVAHAGFARQGAWLCIQSITGLTLHLKAVCPAQHHNDGRMHLMQCVSLSES